MCCLSVPIDPWELVFDVGQDENPPVEAEHPEAVPPVYSKEELKSLKNFLKGM